LFLAYDPVAYMCGAGAVIGIICCIILYIKYPSLQNPSDKYKLYYIVKIVTKKKQNKITLQRRHSFTMGDEKKLAPYLTETDLENLHNTEIEPESKPILIDIQEEKDEPDWKSGSLPKDFFSRLVQHSAELIPVEQEGSHNFLSHILSEDEIGEEIDHDNQSIDLANIWRKRTLSQASSPKNLLPIPKIRLPKSRTPSDVSDISPIGKIFQARKSESRPRRKSSRVQKDNTIVSVGKRVVSKTTDDAQPE